ncbi:MAG TPA: nuclear transport factor 2 family protein [Longimicrobium sp.]|jgi:ketosteroid isomerase-like protein
MPEAAETVHAWLAALNAADAGALLALSAPDIALIGPRGTATGHDALRTWLQHADATFEPLATYARGDAVVVAQRGVWRGAQTGGAESSVEVATRFRVTSGLVAELQRYDRMDAALEAAGLTRADRHDG